MPIMEFSTNIMDTTINLGQGFQTEFSTLSQETLK